MNNGRFHPTSKSVPCVICGNVSGHCKSTIGDRGDTLHYCHNAVNLGGPIDGHKFLKSAGEWGIFVLSDSEPRQTQPRSATQKPVSKSVAPDERDAAFRSFMAGKTLNTDDRADLYRRGITDEQIAAWGIVSIEGKNPGYLCPCVTPDGLTIGAQWRLRNPVEGARYKWVSWIRGGSKNSGELPLACHRPIGVTPSGIAVCEGIGAKSRILAERSGMVAIGAGSASQFSSSPAHWKSYLLALSEELGTTEIHFYPDSGSAQNGDVARKYLKFFEFAAALGFTVKIASWTEQQPDKGADLDVISVAEFEKITFISVDDFQQIVSALDMWAAPSVGVGRDFVDIMRELADDAGVTIPEKPRPITSLTAETVGTWDLTDVPDGEISSKTMMAMRSVKREVGPNLRLNELTNSIEFFGKPLDPNMSKLFVAKLVDVDRPEGDCTMILSAIAKKNAYHPVKIWLEKLYQTHAKSTIDYLDRPASRYLHTKNALYDRLLRIQIIAAVKRVYEPGCKFDNAVVLQGSQDKLKSTFWNTLAGDDWFDDNLGDDVENKDSLMVMHGCWFEEWGEIDRITGKKEMGVVKSFLSRRVDTYRAPYERAAVKHPRRGVIVGSVNPDQFLRDDENRRLWVIPIEERIDIEAVIRDRDALWAAAVALYKQGVPIFLSREDEDLLRESNTQFAVQDAWEDAIEDWANSPANTIVKQGEALEWVVIDDVFTQCLGITEIKNRTPLDKKRVSDVLKRSGFKAPKNSVRLPGHLKPVRAWFRQITTQIPIALPTPEPTITTTPLVTTVQNPDLGTWDDDGSEIIEFEYHYEPDFIEMGDRELVGGAA